MEQSDINEAYAYCETVCRNASTTFFSSFSALSLQKRKAVHAVYALCRWVDDIVDGDEEPRVLETIELSHETDERQKIINVIHEGKTPSLPEDEHRRRLMALVDIRLKLHRANMQDIRGDDHPIFIALQDVFSRYDIKLNDFETVLEGMEDDLYPVKNRTWDELRSYCYKVASAVGLILIEIYGYEDRAARLHAIDLGIQMQLINVLRDINEDMERGRVYLPLDILASHDMTLDQLQSPGIAQTAAWRGFIIEYVDMIKRHQESANQLFGYLDARARVQPEIMADAYASILSEIVRRSGDVFTQPVRLSFTRKVLLGIRLNLRKIRARMF
ncbi:MAG: phytoene/squalene synthase family protein [Candidatus Poseidonia sp.]|nr:phytoene/squalene synthase family protein [Poseidonia sp.]MBL6747711.1 phytoene/squalene synthase family protein [Poseidonia sp.]MBL6806254.1 phytoene/squalene synthase family protein [Poseidonia sp.]MBL6886367.1 phytoene/squalene synthase family protein [Poseidonia sp.]MBL6892449.1 phytoene/squalene synthase family protein [Poseidonia sp.]